MNHYEPLFFHHGWLLTVINNYFPYYGWSLTIINHYFLIMAGYWPLSTIIIRILVGFSPFLSIWVCQKPWCSPKSCCGGFPINNSYELRWFVGTTINGQPHITWFYSGVDLHRDVDMFPPWFSSENHLKWCIFHVYGSLSEDVGGYAGI